jgi:hypothetical protein
MDFDSKFLMNVTTENSEVNLNFNMFQQFRHAKFAYGDLILSLSKYLFLPHLPQKN